ncbi:MAG: linear amide C-N hydrolase [Prevotella sp.]|nr:linear amide C-N hydrolase [Prevotella sp.]
MKEKNQNIAADCAKTANEAATPVACGDKKTPVAGGGIGVKLWESEIIAHKEFKDLGNYVIELPDYTDPITLEKGLANMNFLGDNGQLPKPGCTAMVKRNSKGEVVIGRNMDLDISQKPAYIFKTTYGKYKTFCISYSPGSYLDYAELKKQETIVEFHLYGFPYASSDCLNEKGLYIEVNLREMSPKHICYGLHSAHGEKTRADGKPWSELRATTISAPQLVAQNCATVKEAVEFLKNSYDWYTFVPDPTAGLAVGQNNMAFLIGDATGEYGLIEIAQDEVSYIPYQFGHANYYITPKWNTIETMGAGVGRLAKVSEVISPVETLEDAMEAMKPIMWRNETMWLGESERITDGTALHPYNQIRFQDNKGVPTMDWRGEYVGLAPVMDDGRMLISAKMYQDACNSGYDPKIKEYFDDAIKRNTLVIDDGSFMFEVNGQQLNLTELLAKYNEALVCTDLAKLDELQPYYDAYRHLLENMNNAWIHDDTNFEAMKAYAYATIHIRYDAKGEFDPNSMSQYEKLCAFYGIGTEKNEKPLRNAANIWTTSLNVGVNCARKEMKIRFWENDEVVYHFKW